MELLDMSLREFTAALASKAPTPGGGGASALCGAVGIALGSMVGELTVGKEKYTASEEELRALTERAETLRLQLLDCVERDAEAFAPLSRAYRLPADEPQRAEIMEKCLRDAAAVPMEILRLCCACIELLRDFAEKGSELALSDAGTGIVLCWGAMYGAGMNVKVNTASMTDRTYAGKLNAEVDALMGKYWQIADKVYEELYQRYGA